MIINNYRMKEAKKIVITEDGQLTLPDGRTVLGVLGDFSLDFERSDPEKPDLLDITMKIVFKGASIKGDNTAPHYESWRPFFMKSGPQTDNLKS